MIDQDAQHRCIQTTGPTWATPSRSIREVLQELYEEHPGLQVAMLLTTTGYGEDLIKNAFHADYGLVETVAHFTAAKALPARRGLHHRHRRPGHEVLQDRATALSSNIFLNEACSSGCGSFLQTFAQALGYDVEGIRRSWACLPTSPWTWAAAAPCS